MLVGVEIRYIDFEVGDLGGEQLLVLVVSPPPEGGPALVLVLVP